MSAVKPLLDRLVAVGPALIARSAKPGPHCVMATTIGQMALERVGVQADPYAVELSICNQAWLAWSRERYCGGQAEQQRRGAYLLTNTPDWNGATFKTVTVSAPWDGHLVLRVPDGARSWLVDLDLGAFNRPARQVHLPAGLVAPLRDGRVSGQIVDDAGHITAVEYGPLVAPYADAYQTARDWVERDRFDPEVEILARAIRA